MQKWKRGAGMVTITIDGAKHEVSNATAAALFRAVKTDGRVFPVTAKASGPQLAWLYETAGQRGITVSTLIASLIDKEMNDG